MKAYYTSFEHLTSAQTTVPTNSKLAITSKWIIQRQTWPVVNRFSATLQLVKSYWGTSHMLMALGGSRIDLKIKLRVMDLVPYSALQVWVGKNVPACSIEPCRLSVGSRYESLIHICGLYYSIQILHFIYIYTQVSLVWQWRHQTRWETHLWIHSTRDGCTRADICRAADSLIPFVADSRLSCISRVWLALTFRTDPLSVTTVCHGKSVI